MNTLVSVGALSAYIYSSVVTFFPQFFETAGVSPPVYFDGAAMIVTLILLGRFLEARAKGKTSAAIQKLVGLKPKTARVIRDHAEVDIPVEFLQKGDVILVRPGERIPTDGMVLSGWSSVDESHAQPVKACRLSKKRRCRSIRCHNQQERKLHFSGHQGWIRNRFGPDN